MRLAPDWLSLLILAGATWRLSAMLSYEEGPWHIFGRLRALLGIVPGADGSPGAWPDTFLPGLIVCVWCLSPWIAAGWLVLEVLAPGVGVLVALPFAMSAVAVLIEKAAR